MEYTGIGPEEGQHVDDNHAYGYALRRCLFGSEEDQAEFKEMLVDWFYSGNWLREETQDE